jgi:RNA polymerase sigma-70 factor (ECF subfamily)
MTRNGSTPPPAGPGSEVAPADQDGELRARLLEQVARFCPSWLRDQVDDIAQIAWLRLERAREKSERNRSPGTSLIARVAYCATIDEVRRRRRRREVPLDGPAEVMPTAAVDPAAEASGKEIGRGIRACLARLRPERRVAVTFYLQGHTAPETRTLLGWSLKRAENMIFRGMADLRRCLASKGITP